MHKRVNHHAYVERPYSIICDQLEHHGQDVAAEATRAASRFAADLAGYLEKQLGFFDRDERVHVVVGPLDRGERSSSMNLTWHADGTKRLLPNVEATLTVHPIISTGPGATSELGLTGSYDPPHHRWRSMVEHALARRVVDATLHTFLSHLADGLAGDLAHAEAVAEQQEVIAEQEEQADTWQATDDSESE